MQYMYVFRYYLSGWNVSSCFDEKNNLLLSGGNRHLRELNLNTLLHITAV